VSPAGDHLATSGALNSRAALASATVATILALLKSYAAWRTGSIAMLGSLADTGLDLIASLVTLFAVRFAAQPADHNHRFGHGKAEALAALFQVSLISIAALGIIIRSASRFGGTGSDPGAAEYGIGVSLFAMALTLVLIWYQARVIRTTGSIAIAADSLHYRSDLALNGAVILALALDVYAHVQGADALFGLAIGLWLGWGAWQTSTHAIGQLMDREWAPEKLAGFLEVAGQLTELRRIHDVRTRTSGSHDFVQFHMWVDPAMTVAQAHEMTDAVETGLRAAFPGTEILIHLDPEGQRDTDDPLAERNAQMLVADLKTASE
jgi:ferrous-iron efflux pump FieF